MSRIRYCRIFFLVFLSIAIFSCRRETPQISSEPLPEWCRIYFSPRDHLPARLISLINGARKRVWAAFYSFDLPEVARALLRARERGVEVRVIMDDQTSRRNSSQAHILKKRNLLVTDFSPADFMHNKFVVIDGCITWTGSYNPSLTGTFRDDNNAVVIASAQLAANYEQEFLEMWKGQFGKDSPGPTRTTVFRIEGVEIENYFSPEDDCAARIIELISRARKNIYFATFCFTLDPVAEALIRKKLEGVEVKGVMESGQNSPWSCFRLFKDCGIDVRWDQNLYYLHHKFFIIDEETVITGSFNPSRHAREANDENLLIIHHRGVAQKYLEEFQRLRQRRWE